MTLNLTQLKDLEHICCLAEGYYEKAYGAPVESTWAERITIYRRMLQAEIARIEKVPKASVGGEAEPSRDQ